MRNQGKALTMPLPPTSERLKFKKHQQEAFFYAMRRDDSYLALEPGRGKTAVAAGIAECRKFGQGNVCVYVCPPALTRNVQEEFRKWGDLKTEIYGHDIPLYSVPTDVLVVPDSLLLRSEVLRGVLAFCKERLGAILVIDEAHRFNNEKAKRTRALFSLKGAFQKRVFLSGTPMPNRPMDLFAIIHHYVPHIIDNRNRFRYGLRYCAGKKGPWGWDFKGASNLKELRKKLKDFMFKEPPGTENEGLPPLIEEAFILSADRSAKLTKLEKQIGRGKSDAEEILKKKLSKKGAVDDAVATYRRLLGVEKVRPSLEYIKTVLDDSKDAIIVFAFHKEVIEALRVGLADYNPLVITGQTSPAKRHAIVQKFQAKKSRRVLIANYLAGGVGFNITKATRVIRVEYDWVPGNNKQAVKRAHRTGQTRTVRDQYLVFQDSLDKKIVKALLTKRKNIEAI